MEVQVYSGYDVWEEDLRAPNFIGCTRKTCHPKSVIRPLGVDLMNIHHYERPAEGGYSANLALLSLSRTSQALE